MDQIALLFELVGPLHKSYSCFSVEHHVFVLKWPPTIKATGARKSYKSPELRKHTELRFFIFPGTATTRLTFWHPQTKQNLKTSSLHKLWNFTHALK
jgi:hypothetical protein